MARFSLRLLGPFEAYLDGVPVTAFESARARALLAYLAVESGRPHPRDVLAGLLWPDWPQPEARRNLRHTLARLRRTIGDLEADPPILLTTRESIAFNPACDHALDIAAFSDLVRAPMDGERLQQAVSLYRGPFLEGLSLGDAPGFEEWALSWREHLGQQALVALEQLTDRWAASGDLARAEAAARRQLALDPLREEGHRQLMRVLALQGQRSAALAQYETCRRLLDEELGVAPAGETTALYEQIRDASALEGEGAVGDTGAPAAERGYDEPPSVGLAQGSLCVGRKQELARLEGALELAMAGQSRIVFVSGEPGSGKTTLLGELARRAVASHPNLMVAGGVCAAYLGFGDLLLPFVQVLRVLTGDTDAWPLGGIRGEHARRLHDSFPALIEALLDVGPDLLGLLPGQDLLDRARRLSPAPPWRARLERRLESGGASPQMASLFEQYTRLLLAMSRERPLLLLLDDLQWIDTASASLLFHLGRRLATARREGARLLVVGAYRSEEVATGRDDQAHPLAQLLREMHVTWPEGEVDLSHADGRGFVDALVDAQPNRLGAAFREALYQRTGGHALFSAELLAEMQRSGHLAREADGRWAAAASLDWTLLPMRVQAAIAERMERLDPDLRELLAVASVEGEEFSAEVIAAVQGSDIVSTMRQLSGPLARDQALVSAVGLRRLGSAQVSRYCFRHDLFRSYLHEQLDAVRRAWLHEQVGRTLAAFYDWMPRSILDPAVSEELVNQMREALGLGPVQDAMPENSARPPSLQSPSGWPTGHSHTLEEVSIAARLAHHFRAAGLTEIALLYIIGAAHMAYMLLAHAQASEYLQAGIAWLRELPESRERVRTECLLQLGAYATWRSGDREASDRGRGPLMRALALAEQLGEIPLLALTLMTLAEYYTHTGQLAEAHRMEEQALSLASGENQWLIARAHAMMGHILHHSGQLALAHSHFQEALSISGERALLAFPSCVAVAFDIHTLWLLGYPERALRLSRESAVELASAHFGLAWVYDATCQLDQYRRDLQAVREHVEEYRRLNAESGEGIAGWEPHAVTLSGWVDALTGRADEGIRAMRRGVAAYREMEFGLNLPYYLTVLTDGCLWAGRLEEGLAAAEEGLQEVERTRDVRHEAELHRLRGELLLGLGEDAEEVETCFRQAIAVAQRQEARSFELRATTSLARLLRDQGRIAEAREALAAIYGWFTEGFDTPDLLDARALLEELG